MNESRKHSKTPWRAGKTGGAVVTDDPEPFYVGGSDCVDYYGGYLVAESIGQSNLEFILRACNAHDALVEALREALSGDLPYPPHVIKMAARAIALAEGGDTAKPSWFGQSKE